jgi:hypothetical protein
LKVFKKKGGFFQMKKIIGILLAGAMLTSAFAADFSAQVKMKGSLLNYNGNDFQVFKMGTDNGADYNQLLSTSVTADKAGAELKFWLGSVASVDMDKIATDPEAAITMKDAVITDTSKFKIWIQPMDMLKITFGQNGFNLNQESIDYYRSDSGIDSFGYSVNVAMNGFALDFMMAPGYNNFWFNGKEVASTALKAEYAADFGKINAILVANANFKDIKFGAGYANNFGGIDMWANVLGYVNDGFNKLRVELFGKGNVDAFSWAAFVPVDINIPGKVTVAAGLVAKVSYQLDACGVDLYINKGDVTKWGTGTSIQVRPGVRFNVGSASMEIQADMNIGDTFTLDVPLMCNLSW